MFKMIFILVIFTTVMVVAQEPHAVSESDSVETQEKEETQVAEDVAEGAPETFDPTEEISEDYSIEFPVDI